MDVSNNPDLNQIFCYGNQLTALDVSNNPALSWLDCSSNKLSTIKIDPETNTELRYFDCYRNQLKGAEMDALIQSLPVRNNKRGFLRAIVKDNTSEGNEVTDNQVNSASVRGWDVWYNEDGEWKKFKFTYIEAPCSTPTTSLHFDPVRKPTPSDNATTDGQPS